jgi:GAF domain-containing protein
MMTREVKDKYAPIIGNNDTTRHTFLGIPLVSNDRIFGILSVQSQNVDAYTTDQIQLMENLAVQVAVAIDKARLLDELQQELAERKRVEEDLHQREAILEAVTFAAEQFLKTPDWRANINVVLERLGMTIHATHVYLFENQKLESRELINTMLFEWTAPGYPSDMGDSKYTNALLKNIDFENWYKVLSRGFPHIGDAKHLTPEDMEFLLKRGMKAKLEVPIFLDEKWWGTIGFDDMANEREWTSAEIDALKVAANVLGAAIQRQIAHTALQNELSQRTKLIEELEAKNSELEQFTYTVSHDLKSPLVTINGFLGYLEQDALSGNTDRLKHDMQRIQEAVARMQRLLGELLELSRIGRLMNPPETMLLKI